MFDSLHFSCWGRLYDARSNVYRLDLDSGFDVVTLTPGTDIPNNSAVGKASILIADMGSEVLNEPFTGVSVLSQN